MNRATVAAVCAGAIIGAAGTGQIARLRAQDAPAPLTSTTPGEPRVLSGDDIGFQLSPGSSVDKPSGRFVVRIDGKWVEAHVAPVITLLR
jgi:hypothetical protein